MILISSGISPSNNACQEFNLVTIELEVVDVLVRCCPRSSVIYIHHILACVDSSRNLPVSEDNLIAVRIYDADIEYDSDALRNNVGMNSLTK